MLSTEYKCTLLDLKYHDKLDLSLGDLVCCVDGNILFYSPEFTNSKPIVTSYTVADEKSFIVCHSKTGKVVVVHTCQ